MSASSIIWWDQLTGGESKYLSISDKEASLDGWTLRRVLHIVSDIPGGRGRSTSRETNGSGGVLLF